ncbi:MAG: response regulator FixJ [Roseiarcus sp.]|jgi:two-component system response regulator FixJ
MALASQPELAVFVVDDDDAMRDSLDFLLSSAGCAVRTFEAAERLLEALTDSNCGCVVSDVRMPGVDGLELLRRIKAARPSLPVVIITGHGDVPLAVEAMKLGAADFVEKPFDDERLIGVVQVALAGAPREVDPANEIGARVASLSPRERQVLDGLVAGLSNKAIARTHDISPRTVEVYRANLMAKMQAGSLSDLVRMAMRAGLLRD